jgi:hypothetical protein
MIASNTLKKVKTGNSCAIVAACEFPAQAAFGFAVLAITVAARPVVGLHGILTARFDIEVGLGVIVRVA